MTLLAEFATTDPFNPTKHSSLIHTKHLVRPKHCPIRRAVTDTKLNSVRTKKLYEQQHAPNNAFI